MYFYLQTVYTNSIAMFLYIPFCCLLPGPVAASLNLKYILFGDPKGKQDVNHDTFFNHMTVIIQCIVKRNKYCHGRYGVYRAVHVFHCKTIIIV